MRNKIEKDQLSDGSTVYNVIHKDEDGKRLVMFGCEDRTQAEELVRLLDRLSWIEVLPS